MYELSVACQYLIPRWRQLSVSIISVISILVIALVVWLIVVFFSVTTGIYSLWTQKLVTVTAPIRITPTEAYYNSYYYQIDSIASQSDYRLKSINEKVSAEMSDPYDSNVDEEIPSDWPTPLYDSKGKVRDLVKEVYQIAQSLPAVSVSDYELTSGNLRLRLIRPGERPDEVLQTTLQQSVYVSSLDPQNAALSDILLPIAKNDLDNVVSMLSISTDNWQEDEAPKLALQEKSAYQDRARFITKDFKEGTHSEESLWLVKAPFNLKDDPFFGQGILIPKSYREIGVRIGDVGYLSYSSPTASALQEQREKVYIAGFYDPGIVSLGGKLIFASKELTSLLRSAQHQEGQISGNGINLRVDDLEKVDQIKTALTKSFQITGLAPYWTIETYREYDFSKDLMQQLRSERNLFTLLAIVIIIVACSNIISMLIILVNDKKQEIGILRSMGASSLSIATIFGFCGGVMGVLGSVIGIAMALITLQNLQPLVDFISHVQGYDMLNPLFYGKNLPNAVSTDAMVFVFVMTAITSLLAGIVPAVKACMLRPSAILKAE